MRIIVAHDYASLSRHAADLAASVIREHPRAAIVVATGESPMGMYRELAERKVRGELDTSRLRIFQLDAYLGVREDDPRSLYRWMHRSFLEPLAIRAEQVVRLRGDAPDPEATCLAFNRAVEEAGGLDLAILGLGLNGHLAFNEPPADRHSTTRLVDLSPESIAGSARYWGGSEHVPTRALTAGLAQILAARQTLLLVSGEHKRDILERTLEGPVSSGVPASYLQDASDVTVVADRDAAPRRRLDPP